MTGHLSDEVHFGFGGALAVPGEGVDTREHGPTPRRLGEPQAAMRLVRDVAEELDGPAGVSVEIRHVLTVDNDEGGRWGHLGDVWKEEGGNYWQLKWARLADEVLHVEKAFQRG